MRGANRNHATSTGDGAERSITTRIPRQIQHGARLIGFRRRLQHRLQAGLWRSSVAGITEPLFTRPFRFQ